MFNYLKHQNEIQNLLYQNNYKKAENFIDELIQTTEERSLERKSYLLLRSLFLLERKDYTQVNEIIDLIISDFKKTNNLLFLADALLIKVCNNLKTLEKSEKIISIIEEINNLLPKLQDLIENKEFEKRQFFFLKIQANYFRITGEEEKAIKIVKKEFERNKSKKNERNRAQLEYLLAESYYSSGNIDKVIIHAQNSFLREKDLLNNYYAAISQVLIANAHCRKGNINDSLNLKIQALETFEKLDQTFDVSSSYNDIGYIMINKGELDIAHEYIKKALILRKRLDSKHGIAESYNDMATVYYSKGDIVAARKNFQEALKLRHDLKDSLSISETLFRLILIEIESKNDELVQRYLNELEIICNSIKNKLITQRFTLAKALILKNSNRIVDHVEAQNSLEEMSREPVIYHEIAVLVMLNLCDLLLIELKTYENPKVLDELINWISKLEWIAKEQSSSLLKIKVDWLKSNISLLELNFLEAIKYLENARRTAEEKGFWRQAITLLNECNLLKRQIIRLEKVESTSISMKEILDFSHLQNIVKQMITNKIDDISQYAESAVEYIHTGAFKLGNIGPEVIISEPIPITRNPKELLAKIGLFYMVALGQGEAANTGLFGPLPIPNISDHVGITYSFFIEDPTIDDERLEGRTYGFLVFILPQILLPFFGERDKIATEIEKELETIITPEDISLEFLRTLKLKVLGL